MLYFRNRETEELADFSKHPRYKAMAVYGRRRVGKTALILDFYEKDHGKQMVYFQCTSMDYAACLHDFVSVLSVYNSLLESLLRPYTTFRDVFLFLSSTQLQHPMLIVIDEFPFLAKRDENVAVEFQWIIDHALRDMKLILMGSSISFMRRQIREEQSPLYGRFDVIQEILPFTFSEVHELFPDFEDAMEVYAQTGGVAQYVMFFLDYSSVRRASESLLFNRTGRLFLEAPNLLMQEVRDMTTYVSILRVIGCSEKDSGKIAKQSGIEQRNVYPYLNRLIDLGIVSLIDNPLSGKKEHRYRISDPFFRFYYTFLEPNVSLISTLREKSRDIILNEQYHEFLGFVYEDVIRSGCFQFALEGRLPFFPRTVGKWWGQFKKEGVGKETEIDMIAFDDQHLILGECKYRSKAMGMQELNLLMMKAQFVPAKGRELYYLLASKAGFTEDILSLKDPHVILIGRQETENRPLSPLRNQNLSKINQII
ncbi:MAG: ATP-binding protein [Blautia sp.]|nr:ATP-binding protein [Blautia sp.]